MAPWLEKAIGQRVIAQKPSHMPCNGFKTAYPSRNVRTSGQNQRERGGPRAGRGAAVAMTKGLVLSLDETQTNSCMGASCMATGGGAPAWIHSGQSHIGGLVLRSPSARSVAKAALPFEKQIAPSGLPALSSGFATATPIDNTKQTSTQRARL